MAKRASSDMGFVAFPSPKKKPNLQLVTKEEFDKHTEALAGQKKLIDWTFGFIIAILAVCVIGYITFLLDGLKTHNETEVRFTQELRAAHEKLLEARFANLAARIDSLASHPKTDTQFYLPIQPTRGKSK